MNDIYLRALSIYLWTAPIFEIRPPSSLNCTTASFCCCPGEDPRHEAVAGNRAKGLLQCRSFCYYTSASSMPALHVVCIRYACSMQSRRGCCCSDCTVILFISSAVVAPARGALSLRLGALCCRVRCHQPQGQLVSGPAPTSICTTCLCVCLVIQPYIIIWRCTVSSWVVSRAVYDVNKLIIFIAAIMLSGRVVS